MTGDKADDPARSEGDDARSPDYRQLAFVVLVALALVAAAFVAPTLDGPEDASVDEGSDLELEDGEADGRGVEFSIDWRWLLELLGLVPVEEPEGPACAIELRGHPVPGSEVAVRVVYDGAPVEDADVWFDERWVGRTDEDGTVTGEVPYSSTFGVTVDVPGEGECVAPEAVATESESASSIEPGRVAGAAGGVSGPAADGAVTRRTQRAIGSPALRAFAPVGTGPARTVGGGVPAAAPLSGQALETDEGSGGSNVTARYEVSGDFDLRVKGETYPGDEVGIVAAISGVPMREATVSVDGEAVAETDDEGRATIAVPDDGSDEFSVRVERGEIAGETTIPVLLLDVSLRPDGLAVVPGATAIAEVTVTDEPVGDAEVAVDGEPVGATDAAGRIEIDVPTDPAAPVTATGVDQTASTSVLHHYRVLGPLFVVVVTLLAAGAYRAAGRRGAGVVLGGVVALLAVVLVDAFVGVRARYATLLAFGLAGAAILLRRYARGVPVGRPVVDWRRWFRWLRWLSPDRLVESLLRAAHALARAIERLLDRIRDAAERARAWLDSLPRSASELLRRARSWFVTRARRLGTGLVAMPRPPITGLVGGAAAIPASGHLLEEARPVALAIAAVAVAELGALCYRFLRGGEPDESVDDSGAADEADDGGAETPTSPIGEERRSFRELWRSIARWVEPTRWRTRTPNEIARAAIAEGYPADAIAELRTLFCEVEYGRRRLSAAAYDRAAEAYADAAAHRFDGDADPPSGGGDSRLGADSRDAGVGSHTGIAGSPDSADGSPDGPGVSIDESTDSGDDPSDSSTAPSESSVERSESDVDRTEAGTDRSGSRDGPADHGGDPR